MLLAALSLIQTAEAALLPVVSDHLTGQAAGEFAASTVDGRTMTLADFHGKPLVVNFFASWCPVCQMEIAHLRELAPDFHARGVSLLGVLVDPVETPDTIGEALQGLEQNPLPYPVLMMNPAMRDTFQYEGFPATYFITADGRFSTTLLGYQPIDQIRAVAARIASGDATPNGGVATTPTALGGGVTSHREWESDPLLALVPARWKQWHPLVVHFPIAFLVLEVVALAAFWVRPTERTAWSSKWLLWAAVISFAPAIYTGVRDVGAALAPGWAFWNGLKDRVVHALRLQSSISLHVLFVVAAVTLASGRLVWRIGAAERALQGQQGIAFAVLTLLGLWLLFAAAQVGGGISHP